MNFFRTIQMYIKENPVFHLFGRLFYNRIRPNIAQGIEKKEQQISQKGMSQIVTSRLAVTASSSQALFHTTIQKLSTQARKPMIKFLGSRHPQPKYNPSALTTAAPASSSPSKSSSKKAASSGVVIEFYELPQRFRSKPISDREIQIINSGGCLN